MSEPVGITEAEAALYDRQIRLWGLEAQQRMRNASVLVVTLKGVAAETIKNIVLAGIGKLTVADGECVTEEDLGAGFLFREEDVGQKRIDAAKPRIESLNPLVVVDVVSSTPKLLTDDLDETLKGMDVVCLTDSDRETIIRVDDACRRLGKIFYAGGTYGLFGYVFADLQTHGYLAQDRTATSDGPPKTTRLEIKYPSLSDSLRHSWKPLSKRQTKELNPGCVFSLLAVWEYQNRHSGILPSTVETVDELQTIADQLLAAANVNTQTLKTVPLSYIELLATTARHEFNPVCAIVGGFLGQDILKALGAKEPPIANFFVYDGVAGIGSTVGMGVER